MTRLGRIIIVRLPTIIELHNDFLLVKGLLSIMNRIQPDVVHCHTTTQPTSLFAALYSKYLGIPYIIDSHDFFFKVIAVIQLKEMFFHSYLASNTAQLGRH